MTKMSQQKMTEMFQGKNQPRFWCIYHCIGKLVCSLVTVIQKLCPLSLFLLHVRVVPCQTSKWVTPSVPSNFW